LFQVLLDGSLAGVLERNIPQNLTLEPKAGSTEDGDIQLDILVHSLGRVNFGCIWDFKGLVFPDIKLNGASHTHPSKLRTCLLSLYEPLTIYFPALSSEVRPRHSTCIRILICPPDWPTPNSMKALPSSSTAPSNRVTIPDENMFTTNASLWNTSPNQARYLRRAKGAFSNYKLKPLRKSPRKPLLPSILKR